MPVVNVKNIKGKKVTTIDLVDSIFNVPVKSIAGPPALRLSTAARSRAALGSCIAKKVRAGRAAAISNLLYSGVGVLCSVRMGEPMLSRCLKRSGSLP
jgi:hypothetical protein